MRHVKPAIVSVFVLFVALAFATAIPTVEAAVGDCLADPYPTVDVDWFNNRGIDQPMFWINQPSSQFFNGFTYVVWQAGDGFVPCIQRYNHTTNTWSDPVQVAASNPIAGDGHGAPAMIITPSGKIHVAYGSHLTAQKYVRGDVSNFENGWVAMPDIAPSATYPHWVYAGSPARLFLFYRSGDACGFWSNKASANDGNTFEPAGVGGAVLQFPAYIGGLTAGADGLGIYFTFVALDPLTCATDTVNRTLGVYAVYYLPDNGNQYWCKASPVDLAQGFSLITIPTACLVESPITNANFGMVRKLGAGIADDTVFVLYRTSPTNGSVGTWANRWARFTGTVWSVETVSFGDHYQDYSDFRMITSTSAEAYLLANATDATGSKEGGIVNRWTWNGVTWTNVGTILTPSQSNGRLLSAPMVPLNYNVNATLVFDERIISLTDDSAKMYLWGNGSFRGLEGIPLVCVLNSAIPGLSLTSLFVLFIGFGLLLAFVVALFTFGKGNLGVAKGLSKGTAITTVVSVVIAVIVIAIVSGAVVSNLSC